MPLALQAPLGTLHLGKSVRKTGLQRHQRQCKILQTKTAHQNFFLVKAGDPGRNPRQNIHAKINLNL